MKRISLFALIAFAFALAIAAATPHAQAGGLFGSKPAASPTPTPVPSALPTASPEPPSVAIPKLEAKLKANPNDQQSAAALAAQFLQVNRPDLAVQLTQRLLQSGDKTAQVFYYDGYAQQTLGNAQAALFDFENASNLDPTNMGILAQLAEMYLKANRPADAERVAKRAVTFNKGEPGALMELGSVYAAEGHFDDARAQFEAAYQLNVKDVTPIFQIATTYAQQNNLADGGSDHRPRARDRPEEPSSARVQSRHLRQAERRNQSHRRVRRCRRRRAERRPKGRGPRA